MKYGRVQTDLLDTADLSAEHNLGVYRKRFTQEQKDVIDARLREGEKPTVIAREMSLPPQWIYRRVGDLRKQGRLEMPLSKPKEKYRLAEEMWAEGAKVRVIAEAYGYTLRRMNGVIEHYRKQFGLFPKRRRRRTTERSEP